MTDDPQGGLEVTWWARFRYRANLLWDRGSWPVLVAVGWLTRLVVIASTAILVVTNSTFTSEHWCWPAISVGKARSSCSPMRTRR